jgi:hypothetical protein
MRVFTILAALATAAVLLLLAPAQTDAQEAKKKKQKSDPFKNPIGYTDTPYLPDGKWRVHDLNRPHPRVVQPGAKVGDAPSDAVVLFNGGDLGAWNDSGKGSGGGPAAAKWKVQDGYIEVVPGTGDLITKEKFGDVQLHIEWAAPMEITGASQLRGNSGVILMSRYEIQVLDSFESPTYADGQAGSIYGQWPPLVNAARKRGEWQSYDILFEAPKFEGDKLVRPAYSTVLHNGVVLHHHQSHVGRMAHRIVGTYAAHGAEEPLLLQNHGDKVRYRNIWVRRIKDYDLPEQK